MAITVKNNKIILYEGDTGSFFINLEGDIQPGSILQFRIKENLDDENTLYTGVYTATNEIEIEIDAVTTSYLSNDTDSDKIYKYGFKLVHQLDTDTILGVGDIVVKKGV